MSKTTTPSDTQSPAPISDATTPQPIPDPPTPDGPPNNKPRSLSWRVVDIVVASIIGVASGVVFWAWGIAYNGVSTVLQFLPGFSAILGGGWLFAGVLSALIIRKPGAAIYAEVLAAVVSALIGTQWGFLTLEAGLVQGLGAELVFLAFGVYRRFTPLVAVLAGGAAGVALAINDLLLWYPGVGFNFQIVYLISAIISGAVIAGLGSSFLVKALAKTGALQRFAAGQEATEVI